MSDAGEWTDPTADAFEAIVAGLAGEVEGALLALSARGEWPGRDTFRALRGAVAERAAAWGAEWGHDAMTTPVAGEAWHEGARTPVEHLIAALLLLRVSLGRSVAARHGFPSAADRQGEPA